jgi:hypothetical protein
MDFDNYRSSSSDALSIVEFIMHWLDHNLHYSATTSSIFYDEKSEGSLSVAQARGVAGLDRENDEGPHFLPTGLVNFDSAKKAMEIDLDRLLSAKPSSNWTEGSKLDVNGSMVYSVHLSDINGLSRLESSILANEISDYFGKRNQFVLMKRTNFR